MPPRRPRPWLPTWPRRCPRHQQGIVHRDVKPANILVERVASRARLIDFGIAHSLEVASHDLTRTGLAGHAALHGPGATGGRGDRSRAPTVGLRRRPVGAGPRALRRRHAARHRRSSRPVRRRSTPIRRWPPWWHALHCRGRSTIGPCTPARSPALRDWIAGDPAAALAMARRKRDCRARRGGDRRPSRSCTSPACASGARGGGRLPCWPSWRACCWRGAGRIGLAVSGGLPAVGSGRIGHAVATRHADSDAILATGAAGRLPRKGAASRWIGRSCRVSAAASGGDGGRGCGGLPGRRRPGKGKGKGPRRTKARRRAGKDRPIGAQRRRRS